jgi:hypothetical protein
MRRFQRVAAMFSTALGFSGTLLRCGTDSQARKRINHLEAVSPETAKPA